MEIAKHVPLSEEIRKTAFVALHADLEGRLKSLESAFGKSLIGLPPISRIERLKLSNDMDEFLSFLSDKNDAPGIGRPTIFGTIRRNGMLAVLLKSGFGIALIESCEVPLKHQLLFISDLLKSPPISTQIVDCLQWCRQEAVKTGQPYITKKDIFHILAQQDSELQIQFGVFESIEAEVSEDDVNVASLDLSPNMEIGILRLLVSACTISKSRNAKYVDLPDLLDAAHSETTGVKYLTAYGRLFREGLI